MHILLQCYGSSGGFGDPITHDCDFAVLEVIPDWLKVLRRRFDLAREVYQRDGGIYCVSWWDDSLAFYTWDIYTALDDAGHDTRPLDDGGVMGLPEGFDLSPLPVQRTECDQMEILMDPRTGPEKVRWSALPKHTNNYVTTAPFTPDDLEALQEQHPP